MLWEFLTQHFGVSWRKISFWELVPQPQMYSLGVSQIQVVLHPHSAALTPRMSSMACSSMTMGSSGGSSKSPSAGSSFSCTTLTLPLLLAFVRPFSLFVWWLARWEFSATLTATARQMAPIRRSRVRTPASRVYLETAIDRYLWSFFFFSCWKINVTFCWKINVTIEHNGVTSVLC